MFAEYNIPLKKLKNTCMKQFFNKWCGVDVLSPSKYKDIIVNNIFSEQKKQNYAYLKGKKIYLMVDSCRDKRKKNIYNIIGGIVDENIKEKGFLLESLELKISNASETLVLFNL